MPVSFPENLRPLCHGTRRGQRKEGILLFFEKGTVFF